MNVVRTSFLVFLFTLSLFFCVFSQNSKPLVEIPNFGKNPGNLKLFIHKNLSNKSTAIPLVVVLHGCSQNALDVAELTGWNTLADIHGFMVIYPQQKFINNTGMCFNWFRNQDIEKGKGESESIFEMITYIKKHYPIDQTKIFITGLSAGGAMSVVMMATHPELFNAGAIFAGGAYKRTTNTMKGIFGKKESSAENLAKGVKDQNPNYTGKYPNMIIYQGKDDLIVSHENFISLIKQWTSLHKTDSIPSKTEPGFCGIKDIERKEYSDSTGEPKVVVYEISNLGHKILVKPGNKKTEGGQIGTYGVDKGFHSTYQTGKDFGILKQ